MIGVVYTIPVSRGGTSIGTFPMRLVFSSMDSGRHSAITPAAGHAQQTLVSIEPGGRDRRIGDLLDLASTPFETTITRYGKVRAPRAYSHTVQADLTMTPYLTVLRWAACAAAADDLLSVPDVVYTSAAAILAYIEPTDDLGTPTMMGVVDRRQALCYTETALSRLDVLQDANDDYWQAEAGSKEYPVLSSWITLVKHIDRAPQGV